MSRKSTRNIVISVRLDETTLAAVDLLVASGLAQSRSEAASRFIDIGVRSSEALIRKAKALEADVRNLKNEMLDAVKSKDLDKVVHLLEIDEQLKNATSEEGQTAILIAAYSRANEIQEYLLQQGAELNLYEAATVGNVEQMQQMLARSPKQINSHSFDGFTPLALAAHFGHEEAVLYLLNNGASVHLKGKDGKLNNTPLHAAIAGNHRHIAELLLTYQADPDVPCEGQLRKGFTPLHVAAHFNRLAIAKLLLTHGANPHLPNEEQLTPAEYALARGHTELAELIEAAVKR